MRKLCDVDEVRKCLDEVTGDDAIYAKGLLEWAIKKRTVDEADIRADERKKLLEEVDVILEGIVSGIDCAMSVNPNLSVRDVVTSFAYTLRNVLQNYEQKGEQSHVLGNK